MSEAEPNSSGSRSRSVMNRRTALKAGVAAGVGAAAFAGPQVGIFGAAPAYAGTCSPGELTSDSDTNNTNASCGDYLSYQYHPFNVAGVGTFNAPTNAAGVNLTPFACSDVGVYMKAPTIPAGTACQLTITAGGLPALGPVALTSGAIYGPLPALLKTSAGGSYPSNSQVTITVECSTDPADCF